MKKLMLLLMIVFAEALMVSIQAEDFQGKTSSFKVSKGGKLEVNVNSGDIHINVWDKNEVQVKVERESEDESGKINISQSGNTIKVSDYQSWGDGSNYRITVPSQFNIDLKTSSGDLVITGNLFGQVTARTNGGDISLGNVGGNIDVNTSGGDIHLGDISGSAAVNTMGGDIYAGNITGNTKIQTMGGEINIKNSKEKVNAVTYGGDIKIGSAGSGIQTTTYGGNIEIGNFSGDAKADTYGGDIYVNGGNGNVEVKTAGGDLRLYNINGSINAKTSSGDVYAELTPEKTTSKIYSSNGSITLVIPGNAKATVTAKIRLRGNWRDENENYEIRSEYKAQSYNRENNGKDITAVYEINGGGQPVYLDTVNSAIIIKKTPGK